MTRLSGERRAHQGFELTKGRRLVQFVFRALQLRVARLRVAPDVFVGAVTALFHGEVDALRLGNLAKIGGAQPVRAHLQPLSLGQVRIGVTLRIIWRKTLQSKSYPKA